MYWIFVNDVYYPSKGIRDLAELQKGESFTLDDVKAYCETMLFRVSPGVVITVVVVENDLPIESYEYNWEWAEDTHSTPSWRKVDENAD